MIIDGVGIAQKILTELRTLPVPTKKFVAVLVGDDAASLSFVRQKQKTAESLGVNFELVQLPQTLTQDELIARVLAISGEAAVGGMIVQLPLPKQYDRVAVLNAIGIAKDVDVLNGETTKVLAPAAGALARILTEVQWSPAGKRVVVVGSGLLIGRPVVTWLMDKAESVTVLNKGGYDATVIKSADLVVTGTGVSGLIKAAHVKAGAVVVDFGYGRDESGSLAGDADFEAIASVASAVTPTPGGTGPIVVAMLFANFYRLMAY
jgi:methylenetetrahydrofolate dehydrogenase (NADP+)/methenyltetrahydrofolate cyclohydrolase